MGTQPDGLSCGDKPDSALLERALKEVAGPLALGDAEEDRATLSQARAAVEDYASNKWHCGRRGAPDQQKEILQKLAGSLGKSLELIEAIDLDYVLGSEAIMVRAERGDQPGPPVDSHGRITAIKGAVDAFLREYKPLRGSTRGFPLEIAVRDLLPLIKRQTGTHLVISTNRGGDGNPQLRSAGAKALGALLRVVDAKLTTVTIANKLQKVRSQPQTPNPLLAIWEADRKLDPAEVTPAMRRVGSSR